MTRNVHTRSFHRAGNRPQLAGEIGCREDTDDSGELARSCGVDRAELGVRVDAAKNARVDHARQPEVVDVRRAPGDQPRIFTPLDTGTDQLRNDWHRELLVNAGRPRASWP